MANTSPRARLQKLFRKQPTATSNLSDTPSSPVSPVSPVSPNSSTSNTKHVRKRSSLASLGNVFHLRGQQSKRELTDDTTTSPHAQTAAKAAIANKGISGQAPPRLPDLPQSDKLSGDFNKLSLDDNGSENRPVTQATRKPVPAGSSKPIGYALSPSTSPDNHGLARKRSLKNLRTKEENSLPASVNGPKARSDNPAIPSHIAREKALPRTPSEDFNAELATDGIGKHDSGVESALGKERGYLIKDSTAPIDLTGVVNLGKSEHTTMHKTWAPAVTHETIKQDVHEVREEVITREIHNHHVFHRVLPIVDIEVLPARHFIQVEGGYAEIAEEEVPGQAGKNAQWMIAETVSKMMPENGSSPIVPTRFSARTFAADEGQYKEYTTPDGIKRTETTWIHPPTIETGGMTSGQTYPFYFNSPNPADDGLRARLPAKNIVGISPLLAKQQRERMEA